VSVKGFDPSKPIGPDNVDVGRLKNETFPLFQKELLAQPVAELTEDELRERVHTVTDLVFDARKFEERDFESIFLGVLISAVNETKWRWERRGKP